VWVSPSLFRACYRAFGVQYLWLGALKFVVSCLLFVGPILLQLLVTFLDEFDTSLTAGPPPAAWYGYVYATGLVSGVLCSAVLSAQYGFRLSQLALRVRTALLTRVFDKVLTLSPAARRATPPAAAASAKQKPAEAEADTAAEAGGSAQFSVGQITTIMSVDTQRVMDAGMSFHECWSLPVQIAIALYLLWLQVRCVSTLSSLIHRSHFTQCLTTTQVGVTLWAGVSIVVLLIPVNALLTRKIAAVSRVMMAQKDRRVELTNEMLQQVMSERGVVSRHRIGLICACLCLYVWRFRFV
jgi:ATP-binding cassette subfamily C (CFTR/MRP) protein 10